MPWKRSNWLSIRAAVASFLEGEFSKEFAAWKEDMSSGNPFVNVVAQDIMEPFPAVLQLDAEQSELADVLRNSGIPVRPYVDRDGRLVGVAVDERAGGEALIDRASGLAGETLVMPETISYDASFPEIFEAFSSRGCATLVVTANDRPLGYLTCDGFLSMIDPDRRGVVREDGSICRRIELPRRADFDRRGRGGRSTGGQRIGDELGIGGSGQADVPTRHSRSFAYDPFPVTAQSPLSAVK